VGLYTSFVSSVLFPLHERLKHHNSVALRREMEDVQWWPAERIAALQVQRLQAFLQDVGTHVPYYQTLFKECSLDPASVHSVADLQRLPFLTKPLIRANTEALKHRLAQGLARFNTGGSSGEPLIFFIGNKLVSHDVAA